MSEDVSSALFDQAVVEPVEEPAIPETGEIQTPPPGEQEKQGITLEGLQAEMSELKRANTGLVHALTDERSKRQKHEGKLQGISETFAKALEARKEQEEIPPVPQEPEIPDRMAVNFDDDGTPFVKTEDVLNITKMKSSDDKSKPKFEELNQKVDQISTSMVQNHALTQQRQALNKIINSDRRYPQAMNQLQGQWQALNGMYDQYIHANGLPTPNSIEEAMGQILTSPVSQEFTRQFPNSDVELLIETFTTPSNAVMQRKLSKALKGLSGGNGAGGPKAVKAPKSNSLEKENLNRLANKPTGFGQVSNQAKSANTTVETVADMSLDDFMGLSDSDIDKVHSLLAAQEQ